MALAANAAVVTKAMFDDQGILLDLVVKSASQIYEGAWVSIDAASGHIRPFVAASGDAFAGIAFQKVLGDGVKTCQVLIEGLVEYTLASAAATDLNAKVYASADDAITKTSTNNVFIGTVAKFVGTNTVLVRMRPFSTTS